MRASTNSRKSVTAGTPSRATKNSGTRARKRSGTAVSRAEKHLGATEDQMVATMPPKLEDDDPKQG